jgi:DNA gyrase subunit A
MQKAYIDYSMSVIIGRALPDARDGLKPVHRRILYAMFDEGGCCTTSATPSAPSVVGEVLKNYHPHGDAVGLRRPGPPGPALEHALHAGRRAGQLRLGGRRSARGLPVHRVPLEALAEEMLADIDKNTVDMQPNFDEQTAGAQVLPCRAPNLLVNGSTGIAVGMATNIPPHNLGEVVDGCVHLIDQPDATVADLMNFIKGPTFPTGGVIHGMNAIRQMYETGRGLIKVRGRATIEESARREAIIITEIPYAVNKASLIEKMADLVRDKKIEGISDIRDESDENIRVVIELKRGVIAQVVLNNIFQQTQMETTFGAIMLAIDKGRPKVLNLRELLKCYLDHRYEVTRRRIEFDLAKAEARAHILEGLKIALDNLDAVVRIIRESKNRDEAKGTVDRPLRPVRNPGQRHPGHAPLPAHRAGARQDRGRVPRAHQVHQLPARPAGQRPQDLRVIKDDLLEVRKLYADLRRTDIVPDEGEINMEDLIADAACVITLTHGGYIKRVPIGSFRQQKRGGKGVMGMETKEEDYVEHVFTASTHDTLLFFTAKGDVFAKKVHEIPEGSRTSRGKAVVNLLNISSEEKMAAFIRVREFSPDQFLVFATRNGIVKKTNLGEYQNIRASGLIAIKIEDDDRLIGVQADQRQGRADAGDPPGHEHPLPRGATARPGPRHGGRVGHRAGGRRATTPWFPSRWWIPTPPCSASRRTATASAPPSRNTAARAAAARASSP